MLRNWFMVPVLGSLTLLFVADAAQAQLFARRVIVRDRRMERRDERRGVIGSTDVVTDSSTTQGSARISYYPTPLSEGSANRAQIRILLNDANAKVMFDGNETMQKGTERWFYTPPLTAGAASNYQIRITTMVNGTEVAVARTVQVMPGRTYVLDLTRR